MQHGEPSDVHFGRRILRAAVLVSSAGLAAFLVLRAGGMTGCDGPASPPPQQPAPAEAAKQAPAAEPAAQAPVQAASPAPQPGPPQAGDAANAPAKNEPGTIEVGKNYFPASKAGVFIEHDAPLPPPAREPAVQQQAAQPPPQVAPR